MHLIPELAVLALQHLEPFLLCLGPCDLVPSAVLDVLSPVGVRRQGKGLVLEGDWVLPLEAEELFIVEGDILVPYSSNLPVFSNSVLFLWLLSLPADELFHEFGPHFPNGPLEVVCRLLLLPH